MNLIRFLLRRAQRMMVFTVLAAAMSGACNAGLIAVVNVVLNQPAGLQTVVWSFAALGLGKLLTNFLSQYLLARFSQDAVARLRQDLVGQMLEVPLRKLEEIGAARLMVALTDDVTIIAVALLGIPAFTVNVAILAGGAIYLAWLSWSVLLVMAGFILIGGLGYRLLIASGFHQLKLAREAEDQLYGHFAALTDGIKELKLHRERRNRFFTRDVQATTDTYKNHNVAAEIRFIIAHGWGHLLVFAAIGLILFALPSLRQISPKELTGYVVTMLYLMGPLAGVMGSLSVFGRANVALQKIELLDDSLATHSTDPCPVSRPTREMFVEHLELTGVTHSYRNEKDDSHFTMGPVNLEFRRGELVFLVGGNGSGKSTLAKIITGLYPPETGEIRLNGRIIDDSNRDDYRQLFSAVFSDFYLFNSLIGLSGPDLDRQAQDYLEQLHLSHKVKIQGGMLSTTELSQGQRKRLALLTAYLEDRPFYLFDEWASDQDPHFKDVFYRQILPELKTRGKTVLAITHDDRYFHLADRVLKLDYGRLVADKRSISQISEPAVPV